MVEPDTSNKDAQISLEQFEDLLDSFGANLDKWPEGERSAAKALLAISEEAQLKLRFASGVERLIQSAPAPKPSASLVDRIMAKTKK